METKLALIYIRNGNETIFPVADLDHAARLADAIADSDLLNDDVDYNLLDVVWYKDGKPGDSWLGEDGEEFLEYLDNWRAETFE